MINFTEFYDQIVNLNTAHEHRELEAYLLALYQLVIDHKDEQPSLSLFLQLFKKAFSSAPFPFDKAWLKITRAPDENIMSHKFTNPAVRDLFDKSPVTDQHGISYTFAVLEFQAAELHKMRDKQLQNKMRYFGVDSETGNRWYNFDPFTNLECGVRCILDSQDEDKGFDLPVSWETLGQILEYGRIYE